MALASLTGRWTTRRVPTGEGPESKETPLPLRKFLGETMSQRARAARLGDRGRPVGEVGGASRGEEGLRGAVGEYLVGDRKGEVMEEAKSRAGRGLTGYSPFLLPANSLYRKLWRVAEWSATTVSPTVSRCRLQSQFRKLNIRQ